MSMRFVDLKRRTYHGGGYVTTGICINIDDISRVVECEDDYNCTNVVTKDGKVHTILERYHDVVNKIAQCCVDKDEGGT